MVRVAPGIERALGREVCRLKHGRQFSLILREGASGSVMFSQRAPQISALLLEVVNGTHPFVQVIPRSAPSAVKSTVGSRALYYHLIVRAGDGKGVSVGSSPRIAHRIEVHAALRDFSAERGIVADVLTGFFLVSGHRGVNRLACFTE